MSKHDETIEPLKIPVATTDNLPGRTVTGFLGPVFGVIARSMGFTRGLTGA